MPSFGVCLSRRPLIHTSDTVAFPIAVAAAPHVLDHEQQLLVQGSDRAETVERERFRGGGLCSSRSAGRKMVSVASSRPRRLVDDALHLAAGRGSVEKTLAMLGAGLVDIEQLNADDRTPLMTAAGKGYSRVVRVLLNKGANASTANQYGGTALHEAAFEEHLAVTKVLVEAGADLNAPTRDGSTPLHHAAISEVWEVVGLLVRAGANVNSRVDSGATPLYFAAQFGQLEAVRELLHAEADPLLVDVNQKTSKGCVPLDIAANNGNAQVVRELVQQLGIEGCGQQGPDAPLSRWQCMGNMWISSLCWSTPGWSIQAWPCTTPARLELWHR